jgi:hypothetical protein
MCAEYDFVGSSTSGSRPVPIRGGRGPSDTTGAMFTSRIVGKFGGLARFTDRMARVTDSLTPDIADIYVVTVRAVQKENPPFDQTQEMLFVNDVWLLTHFLSVCSALSVECQVSNHKPVWRGRGTNG